MKRGRVLRFTVGALAAALPSFLLLGWTVATPGTFAFRDGSHFYPPLYRFVNESNFFQPPLWNPYDNLGTPVADEATSAVFYPLRLIFHLPTESFAIRMELYILLHAVLASVGVYWLARLWLCSWPAAIIAGMAYGCSGGVLFQYCNVVFLVGAAWMPFAIGAGERFLAKRKLGWGIAAGMCLALMTLGGDAQAAYISLLAMTLLAGTTAVGCLLKSNAAVALRFRNGIANLARSLIMILAVAIVGGLLALPQVYCSYFAARNSPRLQYDQPRTIWEIGSTAIQSADQESAIQWEGLINPPPAESHRAAMVDFSIAPWHWAEFVWPRFSGSLFPVYRRWINAIPSEDRVWTPSLYFGLLPFMLAVSTFFQRARTRRDTWLKTGVICGLLTCLGWYGVGWIVNEIHYAFAGDPNTKEVLSPAFGGLYWFCSVALPGFIGFRYPAKFLVVTTLALSLLAARGYDIGRWKKLSGFINISLGIVAASAILGIAASIAGFGFAESWRNLVPPDDTFGPLDVSGATWEVIGSAFLAAVLALMIAASIHWRQKLKPPYFAVVVCSIVAIDLLISQRHLIATAPKATFETDQISESVVNWSGSPKVARPYVQQLHLDRVAEHWQAESSPGRIAEIAAREREVFFGRHNLPSGGRAGAPMLDTFLSVRSTDHLVFMETVARNTFEPDIERPQEVGQLLNWNEGSSPKSEPRGGPLTFVVFQADHFPLLKSQKISDVVRRTEDTIFPGGAPRDFTRSASVECESDPMLNSSPPKLGTVKTLSHAPEKILLSANLGAKGLIVVRQSYNADWRVEAVSLDNDTTLEPKLLRANRVLQGFVLPKGNWRVRLRYDPTGLKVAFMISAACWITALLLILSQSLLPLLCRRFIDQAKIATY